MPVAAPDEIRSVESWDRASVPTFVVDEHAPPADEWAGELHDDGPAGLPPDEPPGDDDGGRGGGGGDENGPVRWVTVAAFDHPAAAHLARLRVEADGIDCLLLDENLVATDWLVSNAVGGIKLQVPAPDAGRARALIAPRHVTDDEGEAGPAGPAECPRCGSDEVRPAPLRPAAVLLAVLLLGAPLPFLLITRKARCDGCGLEWR